jgi:hypothetical protein
MAGSLDLLLACFWKRGIGPLRVSGAIWGFCLVWFFVTRARFKVTGSRFWVFCLGSASAGSGWEIQGQPESLILAQNERWRHA